MNSFGQNFKLTMFGESHGSCVGVVIDGCPPGLPIMERDFFPDLERRKPKKRGGTQRVESDFPTIKSGVFNMKSTGAPIVLLVHNKEALSEDYEALKDCARPGHADFVAFHKYGGFQDYRGGGPFSGRMTAALVLAGVIAKKLVAPVNIFSEILEIGGTADIKKGVEKAIRDRDSLGGIIQCTIEGLPRGLGEPFFDSVESLISHLAFSVPGIKAIEFGSGIASSRMKGSQCNDRFVDETGKTSTNHAGGINGGITNGNKVTFKVAVRPTPSIAKPQTMINLQKRELETIIIKGRHDVCFALRLPVVVEAVAAIVFSDLFLRAQLIPQVWRKTHES